MMNPNESVFGLNSAFTASSSSYWYSQEASSNRQISRSSKGNRRAKGSLTPHRVWCRILCVTGTNSCISHHQHTHKSPHPGNKRRFKPRSSARRPRWTCSIRRPSLLCRIHHDLREHAFHPTTPNLPIIYCYHTGHVPNHHHCPGQHQAFLRRHVRQQQRETEN